MKGRTIYPNVKETHADFLRDESRKNGTADGIAFPESESDVIELLRSTSGPVTIQGARTGITGGAVPYSGLILNLSRMTSIGKPFSPDGQSGTQHVRVEPGVILADLRSSLARTTNFFFPPDPTEDSAAVGGMISCNASGARSFKYGPTRAYVDEIRIVTAGGDVISLKRGQDRATGRNFSIKAGTRTISGRLPSYRLPSVKNASGYYSADNMDMVDLFVGAEGTLGIITEATLLLIPTPSLRWAVMAFFPDCDRALTFVSSCRRLSCRALAAIEFFDEKALELLRQQKRSNPAFSYLPEIKPDWNTCICVEMDGSCESEVEYATEQIASLIESNGGSESSTWMATEPADTEKMKKFRHAIPEAVNLAIDRNRKSEPAITKLGTDFAVPEESLQDTMKMYRSDLAEAGLDYVIFGHIGDSHVHVNIIPRTIAEYNAGKELYLNWAHRVAAAGGTVSAEHGIGKIKTALLAAMFGVEGIDEMRAVKAALDPSCRLNPGNLFEA